MKKNQVNAILINQTKRRNNVFAFLCVIIVISIIALSFFLIYIDRNNQHYVRFDESSNIDYKVFLKNNSFFEGNYLNNDKEYIANLIDYINTNFEYVLSLEEENVEYKYSYRIDAEVNVKRENGKNPLYLKKETLLKEVAKNTNDSEIKISENLNIDYNYYNDLISDFVDIYSLNSVESILTIKMYINVVGSCEEFDTNANKESVISMDIPLTTKTVAIDISNNLVNAENNVLQCKKMHENNYIFIILGVLFSVIDMIIIVITIRYEFKTRTAENIYERELKKILNNYSSYIQTLGNDFEFNESQLLKIDTFTDMLEISDRLRQPILMKQNNDKSGAYFVIPSNTKIIYVYRLKVSDIAREIKK